MLTLCKRYSDKCVKHLDIFCFNSVNLDRPALFNRNCGKEHILLACIYGDFKLCGAYSFGNRLVVARLQLAQIFGNRLVVAEKELRLAEIQVGTGKSKTDCYAFSCLKITDFHNAVVVALEISAEEGFAVEPDIYRSFVLGREIHVKR